MISHIVAAGALLVFFAAAALRQNDEFLFYGVTLLLILTGLFFLDRRFDFSPVARWAFNLWMLLHLAGGMAEWGGERLYDAMLMPLVGEPYHILKYDQLVHIYCYLVCLHWSMRCYAVCYRTPDELICCCSQYLLPWASAR